jgi:hypothetical protein
MAAGPISSSLKADYDARRSNPRGNQWFAVGCTAGRSRMRNSSRPEKPSATPALRWEEGQLGCSLTGMMTVISLWILDWRFRDCPCGGFSGVGESATPRTGDVRASAYHALSRQGFRRYSAGQNHCRMREALSRRAPRAGSRQSRNQQQNDADDLAEETEREIRKHPEKKEAKEAC